MMIRHMTKQSRLGLVRSIAFAAVTVMFVASCAHQESKCTVQCGSDRKTAESPDTTTARNDAEKKSDLINTRQRDPVLDQYRDLLAERAAQWRELSAGRVPAQPENGGDGSPAEPYLGLSGALTNAPDNTTLIMKAGSTHTLPGDPVVMDKPMTLKGYDVYVTKE